MEVKDAENAFIIIKEFIHQFGEELERYAGKKKLNLLEEIRDIGFDKILDTNDEFTRFKLKISNENVTITLKIFKTWLEYSLDLFEDFPIKKIHDTKNGFLGRVMKSALNDYKEIERLSIEIFLRLDEQFLTLRPERFDKQILKRRIRNGNDDEIIIYYEFESKELILKTNTQEIKYNEFKFESLFLGLNSLINAISTDQENNTKDCGICYSNFLDGNLTDLKCPNTENCNQAYHASCLREWFRVNPESRTVFDQICGRCLFCDKVRKRIIKFCYIFFRNYSLAISK
jgi:hypothetical protein